MQIDSEETFPLECPVVPLTRAGALQLGLAYWREVEGSTRGAVRARSSPEGIELRLFSGGPVLLRFGAARIGVELSGVSCTYPILGGLLARSAGGALVFDQRRSSRWCLRTRVTDFSPRLIARPRRGAWTGLLYHQVQARLHRAIGRRYAARLVRESRA